MPARTKLGNADTGTSYNFLMTKNHHIILFLVGEIKGMMSEAIPIQPYLINRSIDHVKIFLDDFRLNAVDGSASVYEYDSNDVLLNVHRVHIPPDTWQAWGSDDNFIVDYCLDILGFERRPDLSPVVFGE